MTTVRTALLVLAMILSVSLPVSAAERTIGNGGGLAEMKALSLNRTLAMYLAPCLHAPARCQVDAADFYEFTQVHAMLRTTNDSHLMIDHTVSGAEVFVTAREPGTLIRLSPASLYDHGGSPRTTAEIAAILLAAHWSQVSARDAKTLLSLTGRITGSFEESNSVHALSSQPLARVHQSKTRYASGSSLMLFLEDSLKTLNLSEKLAKIAPSLGACPEGAHGEMTLENWRVVERSSRSSHVRLSALADVATECAGSRRYQVLVLQFEMRPEADDTLTDGTHARSPAKDVPSIDETTIRARVLDSI